jgi:hypothetical protein
MKLNPLLKTAAAVAVGLLMSHGAAQAAVENYRITGDYSNGASLTGTFVMDFSLDPSASPGYGYDYPGVDYYFRGWTLQDVSLTFSGPGISFVPLASESTYYQSYYQGTSSSSIILFDESSYSGTIYLTGEFSDYRALKVIGAQMDPTEQSYVENPADYYAPLNISNLTAVSAAPVPEPETYALMLAGLGVLGSVARRKRA